jgi:hypothetical protein
MATTVKIQQKLGMDLFKKLNTQMKDAGLHLVHSDGKDQPDRKITQENVICKVKQVFSLGKKMEAVLDVDRSFKGDELRFQQFDDVFYLVRKGA